MSRDVTARAAGLTVVPPVRPVDRALVARRLRDVPSEGLLDVDAALRPRNVMVSKEGRVKLLDGELACLRKMQALQGTTTDDLPPEHLSPEQIRQVLVTETTDIYAFAVILYEMVCGRPPLRARTREAVLNKHLTETPVPMRRRRPPASPPRRAERQEPRRVAPAPVEPATERPAASSDTGDPDPSAIIDWILEQRAAAKRGK